ncbi:CGNR zinc finger domain-containing protein [Glycomyces endophyticus]|uniref:CGNR zinc finger domain-containing protein n=1 Tax=Glycomyces endophyticus TaxID=480996 RepID=A0ABN2GLX5_9ACTN
MRVLPNGADGELALALAGTIAHDGHGGVADRFAEDAGVDAWLAEHFPALPPRTQKEAERLRAIRFAARSAFAAAVAPHPASRVERQRRMSDDEAGECLAAAVNALEPQWTVTVGDDGVERGLTTAATGEVLVEGTLALAVLDFLTGPLAPRLRSCQAPRCVRYFVQDHGRQQWCKASCGNRARVARHAERRR